MPLLSIEELRESLNEIFTNHGLSGESAAVLVDIILSAEASGRRTHGLIRVRPMLKHLKSKGHAPGKWLKESAVSALYDGRGGLGYLVAYECAKKAIALAGRASIAVVGSCGATHTGPMGYFVRMCALEGLIGICFANCSPLAAPFGAAVPVLGTNPIAFGFPCQPEPVVVDLATTATTYGECKVALAEGRKLPEGVALDSQGKPTIDPEAALKGGALLPFGGHRGYALALAVQILTSAFTGAAAVPEPGEDYGYTIIAIRSDILVEKERFDEILRELIRAVKSAKPGDPGQPVLIPGERSAARRAEAVKNKIHLPQPLYEEIFKKD
ncbi:MAG TPA: Ldh family oxidoreductase [archaeon]|nr:Ldh family oxidoreductase [archaeon]